MATDGTKIKVNASKNKAMNYGRMKKAEKRLREEVKQMMDEIEANDRAEDEEYGDRRGDELPPELATREKRLKNIRKAMAELEAEARAKREQEEAERKAKCRKKGRKYKPKSKEPKPKEKAGRFPKTPPPNI